MPKEKLKTEKIDYFVFGHRHLPTIFGFRRGEIHQSRRLDFLLHLWHF